MSFYSEVCTFMATFEAARVILFNFEELILNRLRMTIDDIDLQTFHNTTSNSPV